MIFLISCNLISCSSGSFHDILTTVVQKRHFSVKARKSSVLKIGTAHTKRARLELKATLNIYFSTAYYTNQAANTLAVGVSSV